MKRAILAAAIALFTTANVARADTITILGGAVELDLSSGGATTAVLLAHGTDIRGWGTNPVGFTFPQGDVGAFASQLDISAGPPDHPSIQLITGTLYPDSSRLQGTLSLATFPFHADPGSMGFFQTPFLMTGQVSVFDPANVLLTNLQISGGGQASILARVVPGGATFDAEHISFAFTSTPPAAPTPEPGPLLLMSFGLAGAVVGRRLIART